MNLPDIPLIGFAAYSGTGKTTLLTKLLALFNEMELKVAVVKHAHHTFEIDYPGKDSYELRKAGASQVLIGSRKRWALITENDLEKPEADLEQHVKMLDLDNTDLVLVEGFKPEVIPKIELHRPSLGKDLLYPLDDSIVAIASDEELDDEPPVTWLDLNDTMAIAEFIIERFNLPVSN